MNILKKIIIKVTMVAFTVSSANAALTVNWQFLPGSEHGWTTVNGVSWLSVEGVAAGQADGIGGNTTGNTRFSHDGAHTNFIYRSPVISFATVSSTDPVLEMDWAGGKGNQSGNPDPANPLAVGLGATLTTAGGSKGLALLNLSTGNYDAVYYDTINGGFLETISLTLTDLTGTGITTTDDYQLDFFDNDEGSWGWTRLVAVRLDANAVPEPSSMALFGLAGLLVFIHRRK